MNHYDNELNDYAHNGLPTAEDWRMQGREVVNQIKPCVETTHRGLPVALYSRPQTQARAKSERVPKTKGADATASVLG